MYKYLYRIAVITTVLLTKDMKYVDFSDVTRNRLRFSYSTRAGGKDAMIYEMNFVFEECARVLVRALAR